MTIQVGGTGNNGCTCAKQFGGCPVHDVAARPSVPQQGRLSSFQIAQFVNKLEKEYGCGAKIVITPNGLAAELWQALAASRSEATPQTGLNKVLDVVAEVVQTLNDMQRVNLYANIIHDCTVGSEQAMSRLENENVNRA